MYEKQKNNVEQTDLKDKQNNYNGQDDLRLTPVRLHYDDIIMLKYTFCYT